MTQLPTRFVKACKVSRVCESCKKPIIIGDSKYVVKYREHPHAPVYEWHYHSECYRKLTYNMK